MFTMKVDADRAVAAWEGRAARVPKAVGSVVVALTLKLLAAVQTRAPVVTGKLRRSIFQEVTLNEAQALGRVFVSPDTPYAKFVEFGTKPHDIYPSKASALRFMVGGEEVFAKHVRHPGTKAQLYVHGPFEEMKPDIIAQIKGAVSQAVH